MLDWSKQQAPSLAELDALADAAFAALPEVFRKLCEDLIIRVDDFPSEDVLEETKYETEFDLLGLFQGRGLAQGEPQAYTGAMPNLICLYRRPILDYWAEHEEALSAIITHVLVHEIGHHFGFSDEDMDEIERGVG